MALLLEYLLLAFISLACPASARHKTHHASLFTARGASIPNVADYQALMSFKSFIRSDPSRALSSWGNLSVPMCLWPGVTCGLRGSRLGRVVALDLAELNLLGTISPNLGNLTYLRRLNLPWNRFAGILPPELGNLQELRHLNLSLNSIGGQIPQSLSNCSHLVSISLNDNMLQGVIPSKFSLLYNLKVFELVQNMLTGTFPPDFVSLESLTLLNVAHNNLTGQIPGDIGKLVNLVTLGLGHNQLSGTIPASVGNLSELTFLSVFSNSLIGSIPPLQGLSSLSVLHLGKNKLTGCIPPSIGNISSLTAIDLYQNDLDGQIPQSLGNLEMLVYLGLDANNLFGSVPHALGNLRSLEKLYLSSNKLEGELPPTIFNISNLEYFMMDHNLLNGSLPSDMSSNNLPKLKSFSITYNRLHGIVPQYLCNYSMLVLFQTTSNLLSGTIPQCLGMHQKSLDAVSMGQNRFEATTDADWGFLSSLTNSTYLTLLDISANNLQGALPHSAGNLSKHLQYFFAGGNKFTGTIPEGIGDLVNLEFLSMEENLLDGSIPSSIGKMSKLSTLDLENNKLSGFIPLHIGNLTNLGALTLQGNTFGGVIPSSLSSCPLVQLDLSYNNLQGRIPKELFLIRTLSDSLLINHNLLSGRLPSEIGNLQNLGTFDFSDNMISGHIPTSIGGCQSLQYLNTSGNLLQGEIPSSLGELKGLVVLDLSHNNLSGAIPEFLGSLRLLSSLNLSFNKFEGELPQDGVFLNATAISITGDDCLCGGIPQLKLPPCSKHTTKKSSRNKLAIIVSICSAFLFATSIFALSKFYQMNRNTTANLERSVINEPYKRFSYAELVNATNSFAFENLIGAGSFGSVYKARMREDGEHVVVAVKVLNLMQRGASQSFVAECETLKCARHRNLVQILTVCSSIDFQGRDFKALVYKFLPNGNLDQWLHQNIVRSGEQNALNLITRIRIAIDVASSIDYLHQYKPTPIIHCDLKPSNVLLDSDMVAHVGDFGLARFLHQGTDESSSWALMRGSIGYAAPEYGLGNEASTQGDVYSYGVLLLEIFTGKRPMDNKFGEAIGLRKYVQMALPNRVGNIIDQQLVTEIEDGKASTSNSSRIRGVKIDCIDSILQVGISCSEERPMDRPTIGDALRELQAIGDTFDKNLSTIGVDTRI